MAKPYKKTPVFGIPYMQDGTFMSAAQEQRRANIIENQLLAGTKGIKCCVFQDGNYRVIDNYNGSRTVLLSRTGQNVSLEGVLNGGYCYTPEPIMWENLSSGRKYYLYVAATSHLYEDESAFTPVAKTLPYAHSIPTYLLLATLDLTGKSPILDAQPPGKFYANDLAKHTGDAQDPHGEHLQQTKATILDSLWGRLDRSNGEHEDVLLFNKGGNGLLNRAIERNVLVVDELTGGSTGVTVKDGRVKGVHGVVVHEKVWEGQGPTFLVGQVAVRVMEDMTICIYNDGEAGVPISITVFYESV